VARATKLKVFRTPIGFHDAYVAAVSQKAALEAWGSDSNLFAQKTAEIVTDPALTAEPLSKPGIVVKRLRGTAEEQLAALGPARPRVRKARTEVGGRAAASKQPVTAIKSKPRPDRSALGAVEQDLSDLEQRHRSEQTAMRNRETELARQHRELDKMQSEKVGQLEQKRADAEAAYDKAMSRWRR
jgi:hypothetical protein